MNEEDISYFTKILEHWQHVALLYLPRIFLSVVVFLLFLFLARYAKNISNKFNFKALKAHPDITSIFSTLIYLFLIFSGIAISFNILGLQDVIAKILTGAGILGIIAGFAFRDIASNILAGFILKVQHPFRTNDWVEIDEKYGFIREIGWITTKIKTVPGQQVYIPNQIVYRNTFTNYSTFRRRRVIFESRVSFSEDLEKVNRVSLEEARKCEKTLLNEDIDFFFTDINDFAYTFQLRFWIQFNTNIDYRKAMDEIIIRIKKRFKEEDICIAYPITTLDFGVKEGTNIFDKELKVKSEN